MHEVVAVVTNPDKPAGRGHRLTPTPIKAAATELGLSVWEAESPRAPDLPDRLKALQAQAFVVIAYRLLPKVVWEIPSHGALNLHPSLLPAYRGPAPIPWTIIQGETQTGISIFQIQEGIDTGHLLWQERYPLPEHWTGGELANFLGEVGANAMLQVLEGLALGSLSPKSQPHLPNAPYAPKITSANSRIPWHQSATAIYNMVRALSPSPTAWTLFQEKRLNILSAKPHPTRTLNAPPGTLYTENHSALVACGEGILELLEVKLEGRKAMSGWNFANGFVKKRVVILS
jgi:methionyl-tRNA formyltransferase